MVGKSPDKFQCCCDKAARSAFTLVYAVYWKPQSMEHDKRNSNNHVSKSIFSQAVYDMRFIPFPYLYLNSAGVILFANKHITQLNGYSLLEVVQHSIDEVVEHHL